MPATGFPNTIGCIRLKRGKILLIAVMMMDWTKKDKSLLVFFETCMVDYGGRVQGCRMNADDHAIADRMVAEGLITFRRLPFAYIETQRKTYELLTHIVELSDEAWQLAHRFRRNRADCEQARVRTMLEPFFQR